MEKSAFSNGKNIRGTNHVGNPDLIKDVKRESKAAQKYDVSTETIAADDLQKGVKYPED